MHKLCTGPDLQLDQLPTPQQTWLLCQAIGIGFCFPEDRARAHPLLVMLDKSPPVCPHLSGWSHHPIPGLKFADHIVDATTKSIQT